MANILTILSLPFIQYITKSIPLFISFLFSAGKAAAADRDGIQVLSSCTIKHNHSHGLISHGIHQIGKASQIREQIQTFN